MTSHRPSIRGSARLVAVLRVALAVLAAGAVVTAVAANQRPGPPAARRYVCPMHGEITAAAPGDCPICGMALEEASTSTDAARLEPTTADAQAIALAALPASAEATALLRFGVAPVRRNGLPSEIHAPASVQADGAIIGQLYRDELASLGPDELADFVPSATPGAPVSIQRDATPPVIHGAVAHVGFRAHPGTAGPPAGQVGWIKLAYKTRAALVVRSTAIIDATYGPYVLVFSARRGQLTRRRVEIGKAYAGVTTIVAGLLDKEFVVMTNPLAFDAERRLQAAP